MSIKIALVGNPNCGKTTMFNAMTGANQYVGNWPGVTVEKKEGKLRGYPCLLYTSTPWTEDNKPDFKAIQQLCDWYVEKGCTGIFAVCQSSEMAYLTEQELSLIHISPST